VKYVGAAELASAASTIVMSESREDDSMLEK
jgi:hypothetical protein